MSEEEDVIFDDIYELCEIIGRLATVIILVLINCVNSFRDLVRSGMFKELWKIRWHKEEYLALNVYVLVKHAAMIYLHKLNTYMQVALFSDNKTFAIIYQHEYTCSYFYFSDNK